MTKTCNDITLRRILRPLTAVLLLVISLAAATPETAAQELNCRVEVNASQVEGTSTDVFTTLQEAINDYMNTTKFSSAQFSANEKIDCQLFFTIKEYADGVMKGDLQIQATRPVYNASYTTTVLNFKDSKIEFAYTEHEPLVFSETTMESNLTAILNFYAYLILALDFDTFSPRGGQPFYDRLETIVQLAQSSGESGWRAFEDTKNRTAVLSAYTDLSTAALRDLLYDYHRLGLDEMALNPDKGRKKITETLLSNLKTIYDNAPMTVGLSLFKDSKLDELVNIYSQAPQEERDRIVELLNPIYPTENQRIKEIKTPPKK
ncbi:MAG: DUF4835 family protein [Clostridium sp.]|nr:DUF4835 family protein [Clostridium sp.]